jgi:diaminopimelate epimerase
MPRCFATARTPIIHFPAGVTVAPDRPQPIFALMEFVKYQGTGNDFIMVDGREGAFRGHAHVVPELCHRKFGIGSDGLIVIEESKEASFYMNFFNPDGSQSFCGNGARCAMKYAAELGIIGNTAVFAAIDGLHEGRIAGNEVHILMKKVQSVQRVGEDYVIHTGSPHLIRYTDQVESVDLLAEAKRIRYSDAYAAEGINVNFVEELPAPGSLRMRTYERGVEDETLSCGTGVTAAAISYVQRHPQCRMVTVITRGGTLRVSLTVDDAGAFSDIWLEGPAQRIFEGNICL